MSDHNISKELFSSTELVTYLSSRLRRRVVAGCLAERSETLQAQSSYWICRWPQLLERCVINYANITLIAITSPLSVFSD